MTRHSLAGIVPVLPTPFEPDNEELDLLSLQRAVEFCVASGFSGACLPAYASEFYKLTMDERYQVVQTAVRAAGGKLQVIAQSNHHSAKLAGRIAARNEDLGADMISIAVPRTFALSDEDVLRFLEQVIRSTSLPVLVQDFNPGGPTIGASLALRLHEACPQFRYLKLEQPLMAPAVAAILAATDGAVQVLEGWGGMYLPEGIAAGICGAMPALGVADLLQEVFDRTVAGRREDAMDLFERVLPYLAFSLQNMELLLRMEKSLLCRRGILRYETVRDATLVPDAATDAHAQFLIRRVLIAAGADQD